VFEKHEDSLGTKEGSKMNTLERRGSKQNYRSKMDDPFRDKNEQCCKNCILI